MTNEKTATGKSLKEKAVSIKGKSYVLVSDRVIYFNENFPNGSIRTEIVKYEDKQVIIKAIVTPDFTDPNRFFTGYAQEIEGDGYINKTSALENAETSAVGRALAMLGIGVIDSIASVDEINKAENRTKQPAQKVDKPWFNEPDLVKSKATIQSYLDEGKTLEEILKLIREKYAVSKVIEKMILEFNQ